MFGTNPAINPFQLLLSNICGNNISEELKDPAVFIPTTLFTPVNQLYRPHNNADLDAVQTLMLQFEYIAKSESYLD